MASGDTLLIFTPLSNEPPASNFATLDTRNGHPCLDFDDSTDESAIFTGVLPRHYSGGGITVYLHIAFTSATSGNADIEVSFERIGDEQQGLGSDGFASAKAVNVPAPGTAGLATIDALSFSNGAEIDSIAAGEAFRIKVTRDADDATNDTASGDAELIAIELRETPA